MKKLLTTLALAFAALTATAAKKLNVKVIGSRDDGIQYWVKYTINGVEYRSDQALERVNQLAWENMSDEDKETVVCKVYGVWDARKEQFGEGFAAAMGRWYDDMKGYVQGGTILTDRLVERDYPGLVKRFSDSTAYYNEFFLSDYECGTNIVSDAKIDRLIAEKKLCFDWACEAYQALRRAEYLRTAAAVKSTAGDLIQLITDRLLVPNITPAGVGGMSAQIIGACFDHINTLTGMQDSLTKRIVGDRATAGTALKVIENANTAIKSNYSFMQTCMDRAHAAQKEIDNRYKELEQEAEKEEERRKRFDEASRDNSRDLGSVTGKTGSIVKEIERLEGIIEEKQEKAGKAYEALQKAKEAKEKNATEEAIAAVKAAEAAYEAACAEIEKAIAARDEYIENKRKAVAAAAVAWRDKWIGADGDGGAIGEFWERVYPYPLEPVVDGIVWASDPDVLYSNEGASAVSSAKSAIETFISERKKYYASQEQACKEFEAIAIQAYVEGAKIISDGNAVGYSAYDMRDKNGFSPSLGKRAAYGADYCDDDMKRWTAVLEGLETYDAARSAYNSYKNMSSSRAEGYKNDFTASLAEYDATIKELEAFEATVPEFVKEQRFADTGGMLFLDADTELGRAFLADDAPRSIEAANGYREQLNALVEKYNTLYQKMNVAKAKASANLTVMGVIGVPVGSYTAQLHGSDYKGRDPAKPASLGKLRTLHRDFNNRNVSHEQEIVNFIDFNANYDIYSTHVVGHYLTTYTEADHNQRAEDPYLVQVAISENYGRHTTKWGNPTTLPGYWVGYGYSEGRARINDSTKYNRGSGSYAYYVPGYYESIAGSEPDPYEDLVKPTVAEIDAARAAYEASAMPPSMVHTVKFDPNGGSGGEMEPQVFVSGAPQTLRASIWNPPSAGETFVGWALARDGEVVYTDKQSIVVSKDMTLYARWSGNYTPGGGGGSGGGSGGGGDPEPVVPDPETPYEVVEPGDIAEPFAAPKMVTLQGAVYDGNDLLGLVELKLGKVNAKKGTSKVSGSVTTLDGKKHMVKAYTVTEIDGVSPVAVSLDVKDFGKMDVTIGGTQFAGSMGGYHVQSANVGGDWGERGATVSVEVGDVSAFGGTVLEDLLPGEEQATVKGGKWTFAKAATVKWAKPKKGAALPEVYDEASGKGLVIDTSKDKTNLSGLKLTYTPKKGTFKGSFKVFALQGEGKMTKLKSFIVSVNGMVVDGVGYGTATCKKPPVSWPVTVK